MNESMKRFLKYLYNKDQEFYATEGRRASEIAVFLLNDIREELGLAEAEAQQIVFRLKRAVSQPAFGKVMITNAGKDLVEHFLLR